MVLHKQTSFDTHANENLKLNCQQAHPGTRLPSASEKHKPN